MLMNIMLSKLILGSLWFKLLRTELRVLKDRIAYSLELDTISGFSFFSFNSSSIIFIICERMYYKPI